MNKQAITCMVTVSLLILSLIGCGKEEKAPKLETPASESVQSIKAERRTIREEQVVAGYVTGHISTCYYTESKEKVTYLVSLGEKVTKGQRIAVADTSEYEEQLEALNAQLADEKAAMEYEKKCSVLETKQKKAEKKKAESEEEKESLEAEMKRMEADVEYQKKLSDIRIQRLNHGIEEMKDRISDNTLTATADGYISYLAMSENANAMEQIAVITDVENLYIALKEEIPESAKEGYLHAYTTYQGAEQELEELAYTEAEQKLAQKNNMVLNPRYVVENGQLSLGDYMDVHIVLDEREDVLSLPVSCVYSSSDSQYVYKVQNGHKEKCFVETGLSDGVNTEILSGIEAEDDIYYPVDEQLTYSGTEEVQKGSVSLYTKKGVFRTQNPRQVDVNTGVAESKLQWLTDERKVEKGQELARISVTTGQAEVKELQSQIDSLKRQYTQQKKAGEKAVKKMKKQLKRQGKDSSVELSIAQLELSYNEESYKRQMKELEASLATQKKQTGEITIYAPCAGEFMPREANDSGNVMLMANAYIGTIKDASITCYQMENGDNNYHYRDVVKVTVDGKEYPATVVGAYPSGSQEVYFVSEEGANNVFYMSDPTENQSSAYLAIENLPEGVESGDTLFVSNAIENVIVISKEYLCKDEDSGLFVWILKEGKPYKQHVRTLQGIDDTYWVLNGLSEGDILLKGVK